MNDFVKVREARMESWDSTLVVYEHKLWKTRVYHIIPPKAIEESTFAIGFKTPPTNSSGVQHICEHSVLCGSERFPVKEPFSNLLQSSL